RRGMTIEQALTTPASNYDRYYPDAELRVNPVKDYLLIGQTRPLSPEEIRTIRSDLTRYAQLEAARTNASHLVNAVKEANKRLSGRRWERYRTVPDVVLSERAGRPFRDVSAGESCVLPVSYYERYWVGVKVAGQPDHNVLVTDPDRGNGSLD